MQGRTVGQYQIQEQLGEGGMGVVFKALDEKLGRTVALKFLPAHLSSDPGAKERFVQEARAASALDHANICTIHDIGEDEDGKLFIVMSFYDGQTLKYRLENGALPTEEAVTIAYQMAIGLAASHEAGIVHRDVKPANIMVTQKGEVKILDFGVAKLNESKDLTRSGATVGTASYMSPEQARSEATDVRTDIWAVGVVLYEMLAGRRPFEGGYEAAMTYAIINQDPPPLPDTLPAGLSDIVMKCLAKLPEERFESMPALAAVLEPFVGASGLRRTAGVSEERPTVEKPPSIARTAAVFVVVSVVVLTVTYGGMLIFGLPDWVFGAGVALMVLGLPVLLLAARSERSKTGPGWLTMRRASWGGVLSMSGLAVFAAAFMAMRAMGIGPAATLVTSGALEENAEIVVAEFDNSTSDPTLSKSITEALRIDLSQSTAIHLMDGGDIVDVLSRMELPQDTRIDVGTAMEIATRQGAEAVVTGDISSIGRGFVLSARLLAAADGAELVALRENARDDGEIIDAIDRLSKRLREEIGESMKTIRANKNLDFVSTGSLEALRYYSEAVTLTDVGEFERARDLLLQAIDLDSTFAMAYRKLAATYFNLGAPTHLQVEAVTKAYQLRDRLPERERWAATAFYYARVDRDNDREAAAYENLLEKYPDDMPALNNLALLYNIRGEFEKAVPPLRHALEVADRQSFYDNLLDALTGLKRWDEVDALLDQFEANQPNHPGRYYFRFLAAMAMGNIDRADTLLKSTSLNDSPNWQSVDETLRQRYYGMRGQFDRAEESARRGAAINLRRGSPDLALVNYLDVAFNYLERENDPESARRILDESLRAIPLDSIPPISRPYSLLVKLAAELGDEDRARTWRAEYEELVPPQVQLSDVYRWEAAAAIAQLDERPDEALSLLGNVREIDHCGVCRVFDEARLQEQMGDTDAAIDTYRAFTENTWAAALWFFGESKPIAYFRLGELYSLRGDTEEAIEAYSKFIDYWKDADVSVQPQVSYARERVGELVEAQAREPGQ